MIKQLEIRTSKRDEFIDITRKVQEVVKQSGIVSGTCLVYVPHTTAGVTINENADPDVKRDMLMALNKIVPYTDGYHHMEGNSAAHIKSSMMGFMQTLIVEGGSLVLGTWQGIYFTEFDGPRNRKVKVKVISDHL